MKNLSLWVTTTSLTLSIVACASYPAPTQHLTDAESAHRSALELGAANDPAAKLHVALAEEQMSKAKALMTDGENERADSLLIRSKADSELALALARERASNADVQRATQQSSQAQINTNNITSGNNSQGAVQ